MKPASEVASDVFESVLGPHLSFTHKIEGEWVGGAQMREAYALAIEAARREGYNEGVKVFRPLSRK